MTEHCQKPLIILFQIQLKIRRTQIYGKSLTLYIKKVINSYLRIIVHFPSFYPWKIFDKILLNKMYNFLLVKRLLNPNQPGFCPSDSCVNELLTKTYAIFEAFDCNPPLEVRSIFLELSKAFDKVWYEGLLYKLKSLGISGELYNLPDKYLSRRFQRVVLNGQNLS